MTTYTINLDAAGNEIDPSQSTGATVDRADIPAMTYRDTASLKATLDPQNDPERALHQAEINALADRTFRAEEFALQLIDPKTNAPYAGSEADFARRMAVANELRTQGQYALTVGNQMIKARGGNGPYDPAVSDLRAQLAEQESARAERHAAKIAARSR